jgi:hypothetical protein
MQRAKASAVASLPFCVVGVPVCVVVVAVLVEEATFATPGELPPPQPDVSREDAATATTEARVSGLRQRMRFASFHARARKAHHWNLNASALRMRGC